MDAFGDAYTINFWIFWGLVILGFTTLDVEEFANKTYKPIQTKQLSIGWLNNIKLIDFAMDLAVQMANHLKFPFKDH